MKHWHRCWRWNEMMMECPFLDLEQHEGLRDPGEPIEKETETRQIVAPARRRTPPPKREEVEARINEQLQEIVQRGPVPEPVGPVLDAPPPGRRIPPTVPSPGRRGPPVRAPVPARVPVPVRAAAFAVNRVASMVPNRYGLSPNQERALRGFQPRLPIPYIPRMPRLPRLAVAAAMAEKVVTRQLASPAGSEIDEGRSRTREVRSRDPRRGFGFSSRPAQIGAAAAAGGGGGFLINAAARLKRLMGQY